MINSSDIESTFGLTRLKDVYRYMWLAGFAGSRETLYFLRFSLPELPDHVNLINVYVDLETTCARLDPTGTCMTILLHKRISSRHRSNQTRRSKADTGGESHHHHHTFYSILFYSMVNLI